MKFKLTVIILFIISPLSYGENNAVSLSHMQSYLAQFDYFEVQPSGEKVKAGTWTDDVQITDSHVIRTVKRMPLHKGIDLIRTVSANKDNLQPVFVNQRFGIDLLSVYYSDFDNGELSQVLLNGTEVIARTSTATISANVMENNLQGLFASALPTTRPEVNVTGYITGQYPKALEISYSVVKQDIVTVMGQQFQAWVITEPKSQWTYWVRKTAPYLIKVSHPGPGGKTLVSYLTQFQFKTD